MNAAQSMMQIEVAYALPDCQWLVPLKLEQGATAEDAIKRSGLLESHAELRSSALALGIHGRVVSADRVLNDGDRVEIYRPLTADPKLARRKRVAKRRKAEAIMRGG